MRIGEGALLLVGVAGAAALYITRDYRVTPWDQEFELAAARHNVPSNLLRAIGRTESSFRATVVGPTGDVGVMQISPPIQRAYGLSDADLRLPAKNIDAAARLLKEMRVSLGTRFSPFTWAASYNTGPDLSPAAAGELYASKVLYHWQLYDIGRMFA